MADTVATPTRATPPADTLDALFAGALSDDGTLEDEQDEKEEQDPASDDAEEPDSDDETPEGEDESEDDDTEDDDEAQDSDDELLDDEAAGSEAPTPEDILQKLMPIKIDGVEHKVTVSEALAGYSRTQDYTRKTMAVAEERKEVTALKDTYSGLVGRLETYLNEVLVPANKPDPALRESDPGEYAAQMQEWTALERQRDDAKAERARLAAEQHQQALEAQRGFQEQEMAKVIEALPRWKDPEVRQKEAKVIRDGALALGFTEEDLGNLHYAPAILALRKAVLYDRQKAKMKTVARPVAPKGTLKPGANTSQVAPKQGAVKKISARLRKSGDPNDFAAYLMASGALDDIK